MPTEDPNAPEATREVVATATSDEVMPRVVAEVLADARLHLRAYQDDLRKLVLPSELEGPAVARGQGYNLGRLVEAADIAEDAVFNVLNVANSHFSSPVAGAAIERSEHGRSAAGA